MNIIFRVDASINMGIGHIMRCLSLADELHSRGASVFFVCRDHPGQMTEKVQKRGYKYILLPPSKTKQIPTTDEPTYSSWLGASWKQDAEETLKVIGGDKIDWLIIDHYGIQFSWHIKLRQYTRNIMVIDDLADRKLDCDLLLDQTYGKNEKSYQSLIPNYCQLLLGSRYALLRPEFARLRKKAIEKRKNNITIKNILISMGGMDSNNITGKVLNALGLVTWKDKPVITVVLEGKAPNLTAILEQAKLHSLFVNVLTNVDNMAELMLESDLAVGAGGMTSWERCCLGLPSLIIVLAKNQKKIAESLETSGAALVFNEPLSQDLGSRIKQAVSILLAYPDRLSGMSHVSVGVTEGNGAGLVANKLLGKYDL